MISKNLRLSKSIGRSGNQSGVALVLVLGFLVIITALILSFFSSVTTELSASKSFSASVSTRQLAETATNLVMGQIADATAGFEEPGNSNSGILAWASQPGMIRTYNQEGDPFRYYKLYSAKELVINKPGDGFDVMNDFSEDVPGDWFRNPSLYTDLNAPVRTANGGFNYPIVDPTVQMGSTSGSIEGFQILPPPGFKGGTGNPVSSPSANPAAMPGRWMYILRDGTVTPAPAVSGADNVLDWSSAGEERFRPSKANPIVGRIAYWTDDETSKVNINTASEGTFWDRPWGNNGADSLERNFADFIPAQGEYPRYAGHPATTSLSPVLGSVMNIDPFASFTTSWPKKKPYYLLVPRTMAGGTEGGTKQAVAPLGNDYERLFASVDELAFKPEFTTPRVASTASAGGDTAVNFLEKTKFFLTANSRAPEVNLFNKPRMSLWPIQLDPGVRNAQDQLIAFCGTVGKKPYFFQRFNDYFAQGKPFKDGRTGWLSPMPSSCHPYMDMDPSLSVATAKGTITNTRNTELYQYMQKLTSDSVPGFGGSLEKKYDTNGRPSKYSDRNQILTMMFDYIRTNVNSYSTSANLKPQYDYAPTRRGGTVAGETQLVPLVIPTGKVGANTKGFGRFSTITEVAITMFLHQTPPAPGKPTPPLELRAALVMEPFNPTPGNASWSPNVRYVVKHLDRMKVGGPAFGNQNVLMGWPKPFLKGEEEIYPSNWITSRVGFSGGGHKLAFMGLGAMFRYFRDGGNDQAKSFGTKNLEQDFPFYTPEGPKVVDDKAKFTFAPGDSEIEILVYSGYEKVGENTNPRADLLVQTIRVKFPALKEPISLPKTKETGSFNGRLSSGAIIAGGDVVRSMEVTAGNQGKGDLRMIHALDVVPTNAFTEHKSYQTQKAIAHSLRSHGFNAPGYEETATFLDPDVTHTGNDTYSRLPAAANGTQGAQATFGQGDFDNGNWDVGDGAYVNKADEGNIATGAKSYTEVGEFNVEDGRTHSPNRQIASAVAFGSLPTGIKETAFGLDNLLQTGRPWQTLLFTPYPSARSNSNVSFATATGKHFGFGTIRRTGRNSGAFNEPPYVTPPDHLFLDLFTMPVVEPYAISEPLSTAGKINLNYQIAPYTYIKRATGMVAVMRAVKIIGIPTKSGDKKQSKRYDIDTDMEKGTLREFNAKFDRGEIFRSASQICDIPLIPRGTNADQIATFWNANQRTGDNAREIPYGHIYPRVTTKSNTYTVHMRVQALQKAAGGPPDQWSDTRDQVVGEYRGNTTIERYVDAGDPTLPDFAKMVKEDNLDRHYRFRIINTKAFVR